MQPSVKIPLGREKVLSAIIDESDYELVSKYSWWADKIGKTYYAVTRIYVSGRNESGKSFRTNKIYMHRLIMGSPKGSVVDHENHNGLDNQRSNLRILSK